MNIVVYIVQSETYDESEILLVTSDPVRACNLALSQGKEIDFICDWEEDYTEERIMRVRFKENEHYDFVVDQYLLE